MSSFLDSPSLWDFGFLGQNPRALHTFNKKCAKLWDFGPLGTYPREGCSTFWDFWSQKVPKLGQILGPKFGSIGNLSEKSQNAIFRISRSKIFDFSEESWRVFG